MGRILSTLAVLLFSGTVAYASDLVELSDIERQAFRDEVRAYLLENPEVLIEAIQILEQRDEAAQRASDEDLIGVNAASIFNDGISWVGGNPDGDVTLVEFVDYRCGYCRRAHDEIAELIAEDGNIRFVVKEYPILGEESEMSSRAAIATLQLHGPDEYKRIHDVLMVFGGTVSEAAIASIAGDLGIDADSLLKTMSSPAVTRHIEETRALGQRLQIRGTPSFLLGNQILRGYLPPDDMRDVVAFARQQ